MSGLPAGCSRCPYCTTVRKDSELAAHITEHCPANPLRSALRAAEERNERMRKALELAARHCSYIPAAHHVGDLLRGALQETSNEPRRP